MRLVALLAAVLISIVAPARAHQTDLSLVRTYVTPLAMLTTVEGQISVPRSGSAVVVAPKYAMTAAHVVSNGEKQDENTHFEIKRDGRRITVTVVAVDMTNDLALVTGDFDCPCAPLAKQRPPQDSEIFGVGYPFLGLVNMQILTEGRVQGHTVNADGPRMVTTAIAAPGMSGGGMFVKEEGMWVVAGIITEILATPIGPRQLQIRQMHTWLSYSAPANVIAAFFKQALAK